MTANEIWVVKIIFGSFFIFFTITASFFGLYDICKGDDQGSVRSWFRSMWERLEKSRLNDLPEKKIIWVLKMVKIFY